MSVVILGMEMPHKCLECQLNTDEIVCTAATLAQSKEAYYEAKKNGTSHEEEMFKICPLRPLPKNHGRLIDADALLKQKGDCYDHDGHLLYAVGTGNILCAPTIVEAEGD